MAEAKQVTQVGKKSASKPKARAKYFQWTSDHDLVMCREVIVSEPYNFKLRNPKRGEIWNEIAGRLNSLKQPEFRVTARAVRDRYSNITSNRKLDLSKEEKASGIEVPPVTELDALLEELLEREKSAQEKIDAQNDDKKAKTDKDRAAAEEVRQMALQTMSKRKGDSNDKLKGAKVRRSTADAIDYLSEKSEKERELKKVELEVRKKELEVNAALMTQMQQNQQSQQQALQAMLANQNKLFMAMMEKKQ